MSGDFVSSIQHVWQQVLDFVSKIVSPDWGALVKLIPLAIAPLVALFLVIAVVRWGAFAVSRPRGHVHYVNGPSALARDQAGNPVPPIGQPFSLATGFAYPAGTIRSADGHELAVICPECRVERPAQLSTCGNCGLVLTVQRSIQVARPAGPPPGGAALA